MDAYAVLGATGNCGRALIQNLRTPPTRQIHAYCRSRRKLLTQLPELSDDPHTRIFEGSIDDDALLVECIRGCRAVFLVVSTNDNTPHCHMAQDTAAGVLRALEVLRREHVMESEEDEAGAEKGAEEGGGPRTRATRSGKFVAPRLVLLSSATVDSQLSKNTPPIIHWVLQRSASHVYNDVLAAEALLRAAGDWVTSVFMKPGGLSVDEQRGHVLSLVEEKSPLSYLDLAAAMIEAADDSDGRYDMQNVGVLYAHTPARAPRGALACIAAGVLRHYLPFLHPYLPATGPY